MSKFFIQDIARLVAGKHGLSQHEAEVFVSMLFDVINEGLHGDKVVKVKGLGTFKVIDVRERESVNVNTGERVTIESHGKITFTPDPVMRDLVNKPFAQFDTVVLNDGVDLDAMSKVQTPDESVIIDDEGVVSGDVEEYESGDDEYVPSGKIDDVLPDSDVGGSSLQENIITMDPVYERTDIVDTMEDIGGGDIVVENATCQEKTTDIDVDTDVAEKKMLMQSDSDGEQVAYNEKEDKADNRKLKNYADKHSLLRDRILTYSVCLLLIGAICLVIGYYWGRNSVKPVVRYKTVHIIEKSEATVAEKDSLTLGTILPAKDVDKSSVDSMRHIKDEKQDCSGNGVDKDAKSESNSLRNARTMVNSGAYKIVGTTKTIIVKKGETLEKISKFYFGDGMECYIQVHNGIDDVTEGMRLKIPELKLK